MIRRPPRSTPLYSSAASDVYKRQAYSVFSARVVGKTSGHQRLVNFLERHSTSFCPGPLVVERRFRPTWDYVIGTRYQAQYTATADHPLSIFLSLQSFELPSAVH